MKLINLKINQLKEQLVSNFNEAVEVPIYVKVMILQQILTEAKQLELDTLKKEQEINNEGETECQIVD